MLHICTRELDSTLNKNEIIAFMGSMLLSKTSQPHSEHKFKCVFYKYENRKVTIKGKNRSKGRWREEEEYGYICHENREGDYLYRERRLTRREKLGGRVEEGRKMNQNKMWQSKHDNVQVKLISLDANQKFDYKLTKFYAGPAAWIRRQIHTRVS